VDSSILIAQSIEKDNLAVQDFSMRSIFQYRYHILFWIAYYIFWTGFSIHSYKTSIPLALLSTSLYFVAQASVGYISIYYLLPKYFFKRKYGPFVLLGLSLILLGALFLTAGMTALFAPIRAKFGFSVFYVYSLISISTSTILFLSSKVVIERVNAQKLHGKLEKEKTENELKFLKAQINPHFLFNAINSIYVLIKIDPDLAASTLVKFSDMLRYQLYECNFAEVPIKKEIEYLNNYIELEKLRKGKTLVVNYRSDVSAYDFLISPLLIIPFIENAFKHVSNYAQKPNFVDIEFAYQKGVFSMRLINSVDKDHLGRGFNPASGIGQDNTKRRLELIYPGSHELTIQREPETYSVVLNIQIP
jgi:two-component system, LytTR family, sensor kinase